MAGTRQTPYAPAPMTAAVTELQPHAAHRVRLRDGMCCRASSAGRAACRLVWWRAAKRGTFERVGHAVAVSIDGLWR